MTDRTQMQAEKPAARPRDSALRAPPSEVEPQKWLRVSQLLLVPRDALWTSWIDDVLISYGHTPLSGVRGMSRIVKETTP
jgi:hypothetical protein